MIMGKNVKQCTKVQDKVSEIKKNTVPIQETKYLWILVDISSESELNKQKHK